MSLPIENADTKADIDRTEKKERKIVNKIFGPTFKGAQQGLKKQMRSRTVNEHENEENILYGNVNKNEP